MNNTFTIDADIKKTSYFNQPTVTSNDDITFVVNITDDGQAFDLTDVTTVSLANTRLDKEVIVTPGTITGDNQVTFNLGTSETAVSSSVSAVVQLYDASGRVSTLSFSYVVKVDPTGAGYVPSTFEQTLIEVVLNDGPLKIQEAIDAAIYANEQGDYVEGKRPLIDKFTDEQTNLQTQITDLTTGLTVDAEVIGARGGKASLNTRLNDSDAQLAQTATREYVDNVLGLSLPDHYKPELKDTIDKALLNYSPSGVSYAIITDSHCGTETIDDSIDRQMRAIVEIAKNTDLDFIAFLGDFIGEMNTPYGTRQEYLDRWTKHANILRGANLPVMFCMGNHDGWNQVFGTGKSTKQEWQSRLIKTANGVLSENIVFDSADPLSRYNYYDLKKKKTRVISLDGAEESLNTVAFSITQLNWLVNDALYIEETGWKVIILNHGAIRPLYAPSGSTLGNCDILEGVIGAFNNRTSYSMGGVNANFTNNTHKILTFHHGHIHADLIYPIENLKTIFASTGSAYTSSDYNTLLALDPLAGYTFLTARTYGELSEALFDVFNANNGVLTKIRFGIGEDQTTYAFVETKNDIQNGSFENGTRDWLGIKVSNFTSANNEGSFIATINSGGIRKEPYPITDVGHKYYVRSKVKTNSSSVRLGVGTVSKNHTGSNIYELLDGIFTATVDEHGLRLFDDRSSAWNTVYVKENMIIDLSETFGVGSEPNLEKCRDLFNEYVQDTTIKKNLAPTNPIQWEQGTFFPATGELAPSSIRIRHINPILVDSSTPYVISLQDLANYNFVLYAYDINNVFISSASLLTWQTANTPYTTHVNCKYIKFAIKKVSNTTIINTDINNAKLQTELGSVVTTYQK